MKGVIILKKDRNCGAPYPLYPMYGNMMPYPMPINTTSPMIGMSNTPSYTTSEINTLSNQINSLEQRVSNLENMINKSYSNGYNSSNYQMM